MKSATRSPRRTPANASTSPGRRAASLATCSAGRTGSAMAAATAAGTAAGAAAAEAIHDSTVVHTAKSARNTFAQNLMDDMTLGPPTSPDVMPLYELKCARSQALREGGCCDA